MTTTVQVEYLTSTGTKVPATADASGNQITVGPTAAGQALSGSPIQIAGSDGTNVQRVRTDAVGYLMATLNNTSTAGGVALVNRLLSAAATTNATSVKASVGRVYKIRGYNAKAAAVYLKLYNKASAPTVGTDTPVATIYLPASSSFEIDFDGLGMSFSAGIAYALTLAGADADTTALVAGDILAMNVWYV